MVLVTCNVCRESVGSKGIWCEKLLIRCKPLEGF